MIMEKLQEKKKSVRPQLPEFVEGILDDGNKQTLLDFIEYCKSNKMSIRFSSGTRWKVCFKGKRVAKIEISVAGLRRGQYTFKNNAWIIDVCYLNIESPEFESLIKSEGLTEVVYQNICHCKGCLKACIGNQVPGVDKKVLGKVFRQVCVEVGGLSFENPDSAALLCVKKLMDLRKNHILLETM